MIEYKVVCDWKLNYLEEEVDVVKNILKSFSPIFSKEFIYDRNI